MYLRGFKDVEQDVSDFCEEYFIGNIKKYFHVLKIMFW